jgi:peptidoglycan/LPS O-acetylase OafA/YrhL
VGNEYRMPFIFFIFLCGSLLGVTYQKIQNIKSPNFKFLNFIFENLISYTLVAMAIYGGKHHSNYYFQNNYEFTTYFQFRYGIYWTIFIFLLLIEKESRFSEIINLPILKKCVQYSFGIYLMHHDAIVAVKYLNSKNLMNKMGLEIIVLALFLSYGVGLCFYHLIEVPSMNMGNCVIKKISNINFFKKVSKIVNESEIIETSVA